MDDLESLLHEFFEQKDKSKYHKMIYDMLEMMYRERETDCIIDISDVVDEMKKAISSEIKSLKQHETRAKKNTSEHSEKKVHFEEAQTQNILTKELNEAKIQLAKKQIEMLTQKTGKKKLFNF